MNEYPLTPEQKNLIKLPFQGQKLKFQQKTLVSRLQIVSFKGINAIKSTDDSFRKIRILIASMLMKFFSQFTLSSCQKLQRLKKIIYSSKLQNLAQKKGIARQQLLKSVCLQLNQLRIFPLVQMDVIRIFNCSSLFDQVILTAIKQQNPLILESDCQLGSWVDRQFGLKIIWNQQSLLQQNQEQLYLYGLGQEFHANKDCRSHYCGYKSFEQYLRFSTQMYCSNVEEDIDQIYDRVTKNQLFSCPMSPEDRHLKKQSLNDTSNFLASIQSLSPILNKHLHQLQRQNRQFKQSDEDLQSSHLKLYRCSKTNTLKSKQNVSIHEQKTIKLKRKFRNHEQSSIWSLLCCRNTDK